MRKTVAKSMKIRSVEDVIAAMSTTNNLAERIGFSPREQILLCLVTEEAVSNALEHRCEKVKKPFVLVDWDMSYNEIEISVTQRGNPFKLQKKKKFDLSIRGRGLQLILNIMDNVWLEQKEDFVILHMKKECNDHKKGRGNHDYKNQ